MPGSKRVPKVHLIFLPRNWSGAGIGTVGFQFVQRYGRLDHAFFDGSIEAANVASYFLWGAGRNVPHKFTDIIPQLADVAVDGTTNPIAAVDNLVAQVSVVDANDSRAEVWAVLVGNGEVFLAMLRNVLKALPTWPTNKVGMCTFSANQIEKSTEDAPLILDTGSIHWILTEATAAEPDWRER